MLSDSLQVALVEEYSVASSPFLTANRGKIQSLKLASRGVFGGAAEFTRDITGAMVSLYCAPEDVSKLLVIR